MAYESDEQFGDPPRRAVPGPSRWSWWQGEDGAGWPQQHRASPSPCRAPARSRAPASQHTRCPSAPREHHAQNHPLWWWGRGSVGLTPAPALPPCRGLGRGAPSTRGLCNGAAPHRTLLPSPRPHSPGTAGTSRDLLHAHRAVSAAAPACPLPPPQPPAPSLSPPLALAPRPPRQREGDCNGLTAPRGLWPATCHKLRKSGSINLPGNKNQGK